MGATNSTTVAPSASEALPPDVVQCIASFLLGIEVIQYAHASPALHAALNVPEAWESRLLPGAASQAPLQAPSWCCPARAMYFRQRSLRFSEPRPPGFFSLARTQPRSSFVPLPHMLMNIWKDSTLELTFSVSSERPGASTCSGGILVGFQDIVCTGSSQVPQRAGSIALVAVDSDGCLYVNTDPVVSLPAHLVAQLRLDRWHHLLVVFNNRHVTVYLDGELCSSTRVTKWFRWLVPPNGQLGTGFQYTAFSDKPATWQPFCGLLAEARLLNYVVTADTAFRRARGERSTENAIELLEEDAVRRVPRVVSTKPSEKYAYTLQRR